MFAFEKDQKSAEISTSDLWDLVIRVGNQEIWSVSGRFSDDPGESVYMYVSLFMFYLCE